MTAQPKRSKILTRRSGGSLIEMVLLMPLLLGLSFLTAEYGYVLYIKHTLQGASREGARAAIVAGATTSDITTAVSNAMSAAGFPSDKYNAPTVSPSGWSSAAAGTAISVSVTAQWGTVGFNIFPSTLLGIPTGAIPTNKVITGVTTMRKEG